jgi:hypothetical protein
LGIDELQIFELESQDLTGAQAIQEQGDDVFWIQAHWSSSPFEFYAQSAITITRITPT